MSKLAKKPIILAPEVTLEKQGEKIMIKGPKGEVDLKIPPEISIETKDREIYVKRLKEDKKAKANQGTFVRLISNAIQGVTQNFVKTLEIVGTGYRAQMEGPTLVLNLGYSHPIRYTSPEGIQIAVVEGKIKVTGADKEKVGIIADKIKKFRPPDPYKGKGIHYEGEVLKLKPGKAAAKAAGGTGGK